VGCVGDDGGVEEAGEDAEIGADVLEDRDGVERGLVVALRGLEHGGVDAEGVRCAAAPLDPYGGGDARPPIRHPPHHRFGFVLSIYLMQMAFVSFFVFSGFGWFG